MGSHFNKAQRASILLLLFVAARVNGQNYYAIQGSNYAGSLGIGNNPASIVNTPYKWDVDIFRSR